MIEKMSRIGNPLTVVGIFAAIAEVAMAFGMKYVDASHQPTYIWLLFIYTVLVAGGFLLTLNFNTRVLYAPSDYKKEENFIEAVLGRFGSKVRKQVETVPRSNEEEQFQDSLNSTPVPVVMALLNMSGYCNTWGGIFALEHLDEYRGGAKSSLSWTKSLNEASSKVFEKCLQAIEYKLSIDPNALSKLQREQYENWRSEQGNMVRNHDEWVQQYQRQIDDVGKLLTLHQAFSPWNNASP